MGAAESGMTLPGAAVSGGTDDFVPPWRLRHAHLQSIYPSLPTRRRRVERRCAAVIAASRDVLIDAGDEVRLLAHVATQAEAGREPARRLAVLLHGWEGSAQSLYLLSLAQFLFDSGYDVVRLNLRDHGASHHLNPEIFHSCRIAEVVGAVHSVQQLYPEPQLVMAGFSLGGNFALRVAARAADAGIRLSRVVAVCPVIDPEHTMLRLEAGWPLYREYFVWKWRRSLRKKREAWPELYQSLEDVLKLGTLTDMTGQLALHYGGFASLQDYLHGYSLAGRELEPIEALRDARVHIVSSADDPIIAASDLERVARPSNLQVTITRYGGHCGFYDGRPGPSWIERKIREEFERE